VQLASEAAGERHVCGRQAPSDGFRVDYLQGARRQRSGNIRQWRRASAPPGRIFRRALLPCTILPNSHHCERTLRCRLIGRRWNSCPTRAGRQTASRRGSKRADCGSGAHYLLPAAIPRDRAGAPPSGGSGGRRCLLSLRRNPADHQPHECAGELHHDGYKARIPDYELPVVNFALGVGRSAPCSHWPQPAL
jgi:hypothetical protein